MAKMPPVSASDALTAATRFGFAPRGDLAAIGRDPRGWVLGQLAKPTAPLPGNLPSSASMVMAEFEMRRDKRDNKDDGAKRDFDARVKAVYLAEIGARINAAVTSETPLLERMTYFWSNHFTVSILRPAIRGFAAAFEREAIRPYVTGRFSDMLLAVARHPAMLLYLDNAVSIGPDSMVARLNEPDPGRFRFRPFVHEPGAKVLLGKTYAEAGEAEGQAALLDLAHHPATSRHIALKLARHFISDEPRRDSVERIARVFRDSGGDLRQAMAAVVKEDAAWSSPFAKVRTPHEMLIAACRVGGFTPPPEMLVNSLRVLDQMPFFAPSPAGWPDNAASWVSPEAVLRRAQWCQAYAERMPNPPDPAALAAAAFGEALPEETMQAIRLAPSRRAGLALLFASPQFQRR